MPRLVLVGVELMAAGIKFDCCGSICAPVSGVLVSMGIYFELGHQGLYIVLILDSQETSLEFLNRG